MSNVLKPLLSDRPLVRIQFGVPRRRFLCDFGVFSLQEFVLRSVAAYLTDQTRLPGRIRAFFAQPANENRHSANLRL